MNVFLLLKLIFDRTVLKHLSKDIWHSNFRNGNIFFQITFSLGEKNRRMTAQAKVSGGDLILLIPFQIITNNKLQTIIRTDFLLIFYCLAGGWWLVPYQRMGLTENCHVIKWMRDDDSLFWRNYILNRAQRCGIFCVSLPSTINGPISV